MRLILIRHGESEGNANPKRYLEVSDHSIELTAKGEFQAIAAGALLSNKIEYPDDKKLRVITSPYRRTLRTTELILQELTKALPGVEIQLHQSPIVREQEYKIFENEEDRSVKFVELKEYGRFWYRFKNAESLADTYSRAMIFHNYLMSQMQMGLIKKGETVIVVTHGEFIRSFYGVSKMLSPDDICNISVGNCELFEFLYNAA